MRNSAPSDALEGSRRGPFDSRRFGTYIVVLQGFGKIIAAIFRIGKEGPRDGHLNNLTIEGAFKLFQVGMPCPTRMPSISGMSVASINAAGTCCRVGDRVYLAFSARLVPLSWSLASSADLRAPNGRRAPQHLYLDVERRPSTSPQRLRVIYSVSRKSSSGETLSARAIRSTVSSVRFRSCRSTELMYVRCNPAISANRSCDSCWSTRRARTC